MQSKASEMLEKLHEIYSGLCPYPIVGITDDGGELCEKCLKENAELIHNSDKKDGWHVIALEQAEEGYYCDNCYTDTREHDEQEGK